MYSSYSALQRRQLTKQVYTDTQSSYLLIYAPGRHMALENSLNDQLHRKFRLVVGIHTAGHQRQIKLFAETACPRNLIDKLVAGMKHIIVVFFNGSSGTTFVALTHRSEVVGKIKAEIMFQLPIEFAAERLTMFVFDNGGIGVVNAF